MKHALKAALVIGLVAACTPEAPRTGSPASAAVQSLDPHERYRLESAATRAFDNPDGVATGYTIEPLNIEIEPTVVSAKPVGPAAGRPGGGSCRSLEILIIKDGRRSKSTTSYCRAAGSKTVAPEA